MRIYLETLGCRLNYAEMAALGRRLAAAGHHLAASAGDADVCVLNSCSVTGEAARQSRQAAHRMARANPDARLIVTGCYATLEAGRVAAMPNVDLVVENARKDDLPALLQELDDGKPHPAAPERETAGKGRTRAFVKVQDGCRHRCSYCIVTLARGDERSRPVAGIVAEVNALHAEGYREVVLTAVHLGGYGSDLGSSLKVLVTSLLENTAIPRLRLSSLEPFDLSPDFFELWDARHGESRLMPHLHLPAQSGSDAVLRRMARRCRAGDFEALVAAARARIPDLTVTTDIIAGFPGETDVDFEETLAFARRVGFAHIHLFPFSAREGTAAARFPGRVPEAVRKHRLSLLAELDADLGRSVRRRFTGQTRPVLWESPVRAAARAQRGAAEESGEVLWSGLTDNYLRVLAAAPRGADLRNRITPTRLAALVGQELHGEIVGQSMGEGR